MRITNSLIIISFLVAGLALPAQAQEDSKYEAFNDRFRIYLGGFFPQVDSEIAINGSFQQPPALDVEDELGLEDSKGVAWGGFSWHISNRNSLEFEFFKLDRDGFVDVVGGNPIAVGDLLIESGTVDTAFDVSVSRVTYGFSVFRSERADFQLKAGLHLADISTALNLSGAVCDATQGQTSPCPGGSTGTEAEDVTAPLPHLGGAFSYAITPNIAASINLIGFSIELDDIEGSLIEADADITWHPWRHFGIGTGVRYFRTDVKSTGSDLNGKFKFEYFGPVVYLETTF
jgi:hypothetical protein